MKRRAFLAGIAAASIPLTGSAAPYVPPAPDLGGPGLDARARRTGRHFGCATKSRQLATDPGFVQAVLRECEMMVPEYELKRNTTMRVPGRFDFSGADQLADFCARHDMDLRGHVLVWYAANPAWLEAAVATAPPRKREELLTSYIQAAVPRYRGRINQWDVVNETLEPNQGQADGMRTDNLWWKAFGERYIDLAFHTTKAVDPNVRRYIADYGLEHASTRCERRRTAMLKLLERLLKRGVPIDALGIQGHLKPFREPFDERVFARFLDEVRGMGLTMEITEMDVADRGGPADVTQRDAQVAAVTRAFLDVALDNPAMGSVLCWGLSDRYSWLSTYPEYRWPGGQLSRGLPLDGQLQRKRMWAAIAASFDTAPDRFIGVRRAQLQTEGLSA